MNVEIKKAVKSGNSSAVILPRAWLNQEVRIELIKKTKESILLDVLSIIKSYINLKEIIGIYLVGSYARGEENKDSDIDILIISRNTDKETIYEGIYNILIVSEKLLKQKLEFDLFPIGQMIKEAVPLINESWLEKIEIKATKKNIRWYLETTEEKLKLVKKALQTAKEKIDNRIVYTLILRIRTFYIIECLVNNRKYSKKEFIRLIFRIAGKNAYNSYLSIKNNSEEESRTAKKEAESLYNYLKKLLDETRNAV